MKVLLFLWSLLPVSFAVVCPEFYKNLYGKKCIRYLTDTQYTWKDARAACQADGGDLVSIHSTEEDDILFQLLEDTTWGKWIGLFARRGEGPLLWSDGTLIDFTNYSPATDCSGGADADSGYVMVSSQDSTGGEWNCVPAGLKFEAICEYPGPTGPNSAVLCGNDTNYVFMEELNSCLRIQPTPLLWTDAEAACVRDGAHLVSIHNREANDFLRRTALSNGFLDNVYIGGRTSMDSSSPSAQWSDGSDFDYSNFHHGMPNSLFGDCVALETREIAGTWSSVQGDLIRLPFFCSKPATQPVTSPLCPDPNVYSTEGIVNSPNYPEIDEGGFNCEYYFAVSQTQKVQLKFPQLALMDGDSLTLYDGINTNQPFNVVTKAGPDDVFTSTNTNSIRMVFQTGDASGPRAWQAQFLGFTP